MDSIDPTKRGAKYSKARGYIALLLTKGIITDAHPYGAICKIVPP